MTRLVLLALAVTIATVVVVAPTATRAEHLGAGMAICDPDAVKACYALDAKSPECSGDRGKSCRPCDNGVDPPICGYVPGAAGKMPCITDGVNGFKKEWQFVATDAVSVPVRAY
jgi:hypothetical protein